MPDQKDDSIILINKRFKQSRDYAQTYQTNAKKWYKHYRSYKAKSDFPFKNNIFVPYCFTLIETSVAREATTALSRSPVASCQSRLFNSSNGDKLAKGWERYVNYYLENPDFEFYLEYMNHIKNQRIYGNGTIMVTPEFDINDPFLKFKGPKFESRSFWDIFPDPTCRRATRARYMIYRSIVPWEDIEEKMAQGIYEKISKDDIKANTNTYFAETQSDAIKETGREAKDIIQKDENTYEILDYFSVGNIETVIGGATKVRDTKKNPKSKLPYNHPFNESRYITHPEEYYGSGMPETVDGLIEELNLIRNQRRDNVDIAINKMFIIDMNSDIDEDDLVSCPGGAIRTLNMDGIKPLEFENVTENAYTEESIVKQDFENALGEFIYSRGGTPERRETATTIVRLQGAAQTRFTMSMQVNEITCFRQICMKIALMGHRYQDIVDMTKIVGDMNLAKEMKNMPIADLSAGYNFKFANTDMSGMKEIRTNMISQALELALKMPMQATMQGPTPYAIDSYPLAKKLYENLDFDNVEENIVKKAPPPPPQVQPGMQMGGPGGPGMPPQPGQVGRNVMPAELLAALSQGQGLPPGGPIQ